jgi:hypothetical protein
MGKAEQKRVISSKQNIPKLLKLVLKLDHQRMVGKFEVSKSIVAWPTLAEKHMHMSLVFGYFIILGQVLDSLWAIQQALLHKDYHEPTLSFVIDFASISGH